MRSWLRTAGAPTKSPFTMTRILRSILITKENFDTKDATTIIVTKEGPPIRGLVISETPQNVVLKTATDQEPVTVSKAQA
jgi:hypothetical protein